MLTTQKKVIKVTFNGDMKRVKMTNNYTTLVEQTHKAFGNGIIPADFKFYYMDEDNEMISINSQYDLDEALEITEQATLKLIASSNVQEARSQLCQDISETVSMRESLNQSGFFNAPTQGMVMNLDLKSMPSATSYQHETEAQTERAPIMRSAFEDEFEALQNAPEIAICDFEEVLTKQDMKIADPVQAEQELVQEEQKVEAPKTKKIGKKQKQKIAKRKKLAEKSDSDSSSENEMTDEVANQVRDEVHDYCKQAFHVMLSEFIVDKRTKQAEMEHKGFECDGCGVNPIKGIRFKCSVHPDYDLCEECEAKGTFSKHPMLKIRDPSCAPAQLICQYKNIPAHKDSSMTIIENHPQQKEEKKCERAPEQKFIKYSGRFVKESFGDKYIVNPGQTIRKTWTFRNDGKTTWPEDTLFIQTNGDNLNAIPVCLGASVSADQEYTWEVELTAPMKEGRYQCYFRMVTGKNYRFGHKVWADILVQAPEVVVDTPVQVQEEVKVEEPVVAVCDFIAESVADVKASQAEEEEDDYMDSLMEQEPTESTYPVIEQKDLPEESEFADKQGSDWMQNTINEADQSLSASLSKSVQNAYGLVTPKETYCKKAAELESDATLKGLCDLFDLGFGNFELNQALLVKYNNDIQLVATLLCEGVLSESCVEQVFKEE